MKVNFIADAAQARCSVAGNLVMNLDMTQQQMFSALKQFMFHITDEKWEEWKKEIDEENENGI